MKVWGVELSFAEEVAQSLGIKLYNVRENSTNFECVLRPVSGGSDKYRRTSVSTFSRGRRVHAVCFHGHYAWMLQIFDAYPSARIKSSMFDYKGRTCFLNNADNVGERNVGAPVAPIGYEDACICTPDDIESAYNGGLV